MEMHNDFQNIAASVTCKTSRWILRPDCAPSSERPQFVDLWSGSAEWCRRNISGPTHRRLRLPARCCTLALHSASSERIPFDWREVAGMANFKIYLLHQFCSNRVDFLYNTQETQMQKNDGPEFGNSNSVIFENFFKFSKRRRAVPLQPIWTIMAAAKLDHSRVLVTKFHQNRSTLKGRIAGQRHTQTDLQANSAENKGPSGLQSGQQKTIDRYAGWAKSARKTCGKSWPELVRKKWNWVRKTISQINDSIN